MHLLRLASPKWEAAKTVCSFSRTLLLLATLWCIGATPTAAQSCGSSNPIVCENQLPGTSDWAISGAGDLTIQGFATDISVNSGQTVSFKISTPATSYHIDIYRLGYYQGMGGRLVATITPSASLPQTQPACVTNASTFLYDCGNWAVSASWQVPSTAVSGIYLAVPTRNDTRGASHIPFIVRNDSRNADILFQTSDETWEAYNPYGGHSLYGDTGFNLPNRAFKVSYNRPYWTRNLEAATWLFNAEYPMIKWLERNGYDVSYFTDVDAVRNGSLIANHKIYLSVGHDEYWSGPRRANVQTALAGGVNLAFFSGNEMFWKTRWENSIDGTNTPFRTLVCYKETLANSKIDPQDPPTWTGTWMDPRFSPPADGGLPQNAVTGTLFRVNGPGSDNTNLSIKTPADYAHLRFWRNTSVANLSAGQTATFPAGTLGYEWDVDEDNGFRPAGLIDLSSASYNLTTDLLLDYGATYGSGPATHHLTLYRAPSGALVFGAGTVQWAWGLDSDHDGGNAAPDIRMQQATANLFADMGAQASTLQSGLVTPTQSTDSTPPESTITSPSPGATIEFGSVVTITGTASDAGGGVVAAVEVSFDGGKVWHAATGRDDLTYTWTALASGSATILSRAIDDSGNIETPGAGVTVKVPGVLISPDVAVSTDSPSASSTIKSPSFSTATGNELLLAFVAADELSGTVTVTGVSGAGLTWVLVGRTNAQGGTSEIWRAFAPNPLNNVTATATLSQSVASSMTIKSFSGVDTSGTNGSGAIGAVGSGHAASGAPSARLTTTRNGSWVFGVGNDYDNAIARTPGSGQTVLHQYLTPAGDTYWVQMENAPTGLSGTQVTLNDTAPTGDQYNFTICEILPSPAPTYNISGSIASASDGNGATVTASGPSNATATADASGNFTFFNLSNGTYTITPNKAGFTFAPVSQSVTVNGANVNGINFTATPLPTFSVSGSINGGAGATVNLTPTGEGGTNATVTADASGNFSFQQVLNGTYTISPSKTGFTFTPVNQMITVNGANVTGVNFTATAIPTWSISGTITPASTGSSATVKLTGASSASTTADSSGNYSFAGLVNGNYTVTPTKAGVAFTPSSQTVTIAGASIGGVDFTAATIQAIAIDATVFKDQNSASSTVTSPAFSTNSGGELILAFISGDYSSGTNTKVNSVTGAGLTWTLVQRTNTQSGTAEIWRAFATSPLSNVTVAATLSHSVASSMTIMSFAGVNAAGAIGATGSGNARSGAPTASLTTTRAGSLVVGVGTDFDNAIARSVGTGQTLVHQLLSTTGDTYWVQMATTPVAASGTKVTINDTAPTGDRYDLSICEILSQ